MSRKPRLPVLLARRVFGNSTWLLEAHCPFCNRHHVHGAGDRPGDGNGHRSAHCSEPTSPFLKTGYILREVTPRDVAARRRR